MTNTTNRYGTPWGDWYDAFLEHGCTDAGAAALANKCETWAANNPRMTWQDVFDAVLLTEETDVTTASA